MQDELDLSVDRGTRTPLGAQLAGRIRTAVEDGTLVPGDRLPSVRELADIAGVNVNTVRAVYARLESEGRVSSEQGRGTFVAARPPTGGTATRQELHRQIAALEAALVRLPPPPLSPDDSRAVSPPSAALLSTEDLEAVRDGLVVRLHELDAQRAEVLQRLGELGAEEETIEATPPRRATPSLAGARIRWVGA
jgi:DNA-binding transcriptional regulator YhcF (GntR family)